MPKCEGPLYDPHYAQKRRQNSGLTIHRTAEITTNRGEPH
jgi:hypothetical protein